jgi:hypothetical protein
MGHRAGRARRCRADAPPCTHEPRATREFESCAKPPQMPAKLLRKNRIEPSRNAGGGKAIVLARRVE